MKIVLFALISLFIVSGCTQGNGPSSDLADQDNVSSPKPAGLSAPRDTGTVEATILLLKLDDKCSDYTNSDGKCPSNYFPQDLATIQIDIILNYKNLNLNN